MGSPMSKSLFANPKAALGFAGVTIAIAIAASFSVGMFVPDAGEDPESVASPEVAPAPAAPRPAAQTTTWADAGAEDGFDDDWGAAATDTVGNRGWNQSTNGNEMVEPTFGNFSPESSNGPRQASSAPSRGGSGSSASVRSGASPSAPPLNPPSGGQDNPEISIEN